MPIWRWHFGIKKTTPAPEAVGELTTVKAREGALVFGKFGLPELLIILFIALLIFGPRKLGDLGKSLGEGIRGFRSTMKDGDPEHKA